MSQVPGFIELEKELLPYRKILAQAADVIINENVSKYPIFIIHQQELDMGLALIEASEKLKWSVNASTLEEFVTKKLVFMDRVQEFISALPCCRRLKRQLCKSCSGPQLGNTTEEQHELGDSMKHFVIVGVLVAIVTVVVTLLLEGIGLMPVAASAQAGPIDALFGQHVRVISFLFALIVVFMLYSVVLFPRRPGDTGDGDHFEGHTGLEIAWTIVPLATVLYLLYFGAEALAETRKVDPQAMLVNVTASQWAWKFEYPELGVTSNTLNLPVGRQVISAAAASSNYKLNTWLNASIQDLIQAVPATTTVPEPATALLGALGLAGMAALRRRKA